MNYCVAQHYQGKRLFKGNNRSEKRHNITL